MKTILLFSILLCAIALPALGELTDADLDKIRLIVKEEIKPIKADIVTLKTDMAVVKTEVTNLKETVDKQFVGVNNQITHVQNVTYGLIALIVVAVGIPQIVIAWRDRGQKAQAERVKNLENQISIIAEQTGVGSHVIG